MSKTHSLKLCNVGDKSYRATAGFVFKRDTVKQCYVERKFSASSQALICQAEQIVIEYQAQGYELTLRQLYYQFVSRDLLGNTVQNYKRLGSVINDARLAGLIDWEAIEDRTRHTTQWSHKTDPGHAINEALRYYALDMWVDQPVRPEVWIEKEALAGVIESICMKLDIPFLSCRGYTSQSEMWKSAQRMVATIQDGATPLILHFGDHDPSGIDMSRDIRERLAMFISADVDEQIDFRRMALNMEQIDEFSPPPNPAKITDSRFASYEREYGNESWELDALEPKVISGLIEKEVKDVIDWDKWEARVKVQAEHRAILEKLAKNWNKKR